ncbi:MAG TPA: CvpA family protein [Clostridiaceae bacterium]|nr:CvpA family protein [Clostridiaceae bacterium]
MTCDVLIVLILLLFAWLGYRRGLLLTAVSFVSSLISILIAFLLVRPISRWLLNLGLFSGAMKDFSDKIHESAGSYPASIAPILEKLGMPESWTRRILQTPSTTGEAVIDRAVTSVWQLILSALVLVVVFLIIKLVLGLIARLLTPTLNGIPVIGWLNRSGGLVLGLAWGIFTLWIVMMVLTSFSLMSFPIRHFIDGSKILAFISEKDIFRSLLDTIF